MARYRKVDSRIWNDQKFTSLSDDGQLVFLFLLTHPHQTALGAMRATVPGLAAEKGWLTERLSEAFQEALSKGMVRHDEKASCVWLPNFLKYNRPESPNVVRAWGSAADLIPECQLKLECIQAAKDFLKAFKEAFHKAFREAFGEAFRKTSPYPEQEQEPEQEPLNLNPPTPLRGGLPGANAPPGRKPRAVRDRSLAAWNATLVAIDHVRGTDLTWQYVTQQLNDPAAEAAIERVGGHKSLADRTKFTTGDLERRFRDAYETNLQEQPTGADPGKEREGSHA